MIIKNRRMHISIPIRKDRLDYLQYGQFLAEFIDNSIQFFHTALFILPRNVLYRFSPNSNSIDY